MATPDTLGVAPSRLTGITATASTSYPGWPVSNLFDDVVGGSTNSWSASTVAPAWTQAQLASSAVVNSYKIVARTDAPASAPSAWTFEGSNDGSSWSILDTQTGQSWTAGFGRTYSIANSTSYLYYRLNMSAAQGGGATWPSFTEWVIYAGTSPSLLDWWKADAITGVANGATLPAANIVDSSGNGHAFTSSARQGIYRTTGPSGKPFIDGSTTSGFSYAGASTAAPSGDYTYFAVVRTSSAATQSIIGSVGAGGGAQLRLTNYTVQIDQDGVSTVATSTATVPSNEWVIIIASYSRDTGAYTVNIQGTTNNISGPVGRNYTNPGTLSLGSFRGSTTDVWQGGIAEIGRYASVLSAGDQSSLYTYLFNKYFTGPVTTQVETLYVESVTSGSMNAQVEAAYAEAITTGVSSAQVEATYVESVTSGKANAQAEALYLEALTPVMPAQVETVYAETLLASTPPTQVETVYAEAILATTPPARAETVYAEVIMTTAAPTQVETQYLEVLLMPIAGPLPFKGWGVPI